MVTPPKADYRRVPVTTAALPLLNGWDPAADERVGNQCLVVRSLVVLEPGA